MNDSRGFDFAKKASEFSDYPTFHLGCCAVYKNKVIAVSWNTVKTSPLQEQYNKYRGYPILPNKHGTHAEMSCINKIRDLDIDFSKVTFYIYRETKKGEIALSKPCGACSKAIRDLGIREIHYTGNLSYIVERYL